MEGLLGLVAFTIAMSVASLVSSVRRRSQLATWRKGAVRAGLTGVAEGEGGIFTGGFLAGSRDGLLVRLESYRRGRYEHGTRIVVSGLGHGTDGLTLRREGLGTTFEKRFIGEREIEVGDPSFDAEYFIQGQAALALAILGGETRRRVGRLLRGRVDVPGRQPVGVGAWLADGVLQVEVKESGFTGSRERIPEILEGVLDVARLLVAPKDVPGRIAANLALEGEAGARLADLLTLSREFPRHPATREALLAARGDSDEEMRLRAGIALGEEGRETLLDLVRDAGTGDACSARAAAALGEGLPPELASETLRRALGGAGRPQTAVACLEAQGRLGRPKDEGLLLEALGSGDPQVAVAAARALGRAGTVAAVVPLREAAEYGGERRRAARQAIAEIQARLQGAAPGQLTLASSGTGALSLAEDEPGQLSLAEEDAERPHLPEREAEPQERVPAPERRLERQ